MYISRKILIALVLVAGRRGRCVLVRDFTRLQRPRIRPGLRLGSFRTRDGLQPSQKRTCRLKLRQGNDFLLNALGTAEHRDPARGLAGVDKDEVHKLDCGRCRCERRQRYL